MLSNRDFWRPNLTCLFFVFRNSWATGAPGQLWILSWAVDPALVIPTGPPWPLLSSVELHPKCDPWHNERTGPHLPDICWDIPLSHGWRWHLENTGKRTEKLTDWCSKGQILNLCSCPDDVTTLSSRRARAASGCASVLGSRRLSRFGSCLLLDCLSHQSSLL